MATANGNHSNRNILGTNTSSLVPGVVNLTCYGGASAAVAAAAAGGGSHSSSWGCQMDALVSDLSHALDESHTLQRKRRPFRRRANQSKGNGCFSDYSSSSAEDAVHTGGANSQDNKSSMHLTDSDEGVNRCARVPRYRPARTLRPPRAAAGLVESDSVNENFSPASRPSNMRRKPKCKRLALDVAGDAVNSSSCRSARWRSSLVVHRVHTLHTPARWSALCGGKRKRSRDGACGGEGRGEGDDLVLSSWTPSVSFASSRCCNGSNGRLRSSELVGGTSTSGGGDCSISSDESDGGELPADGNDAVHCEVFTCDEGREADDEQSDWVTEVPGPVYGVPSPSTAMACDEAGSGGTLYSSRLRFQKIRERILVSGTSCVSF
ncbi:uncharacterized protein LOC108668531 [Hyalella azteca]|uniref:Uncharacterized protein LOC108668531 n=1 Tax=Hyalella azteca TaxID=294128 RepID=A0A8B7NCD7_HYAAZ|nr:uncharacterized protein LOC108668531 [Hyalella azteca]